MPNVWNIYTGSVCEWNYELYFLKVLSYLIYDASDTGRKVEDPDLLERIRLTIINNLLKYHPVCMLSWYP